MAQCLWLIFAIFGAGVIGMRVSRTHIPRDACFPARISLTHLCLQDIVIYASPGILFPRLRCEVAIAMIELA